jgi:hypothetical protein
VPTHTPMHSPAPAYMRHISMRHARFIEGEAGAAGAGGDQAGATGPAEQDGAQEREAGAGMPAAPAGSESSAFEELPQYWQDQIRLLRGEAGARRVSERDAKQAAEGAKSELTQALERITALEQVNTDAAAATRAAESRAAKVQLLAARGLDTSKLLPLLTGESAEEWEKAADALVELRGTNKGPRPDPAQVAASKNNNTHTDEEQAAAAFFGLN